MSKRQWICLIGVWVIILPFVGVPSPWPGILAALTGVVIIGIGYNLPEDKKIENQTKNTAFVESNTKDQQHSA